MKLSAAERFGAWSPARAFVNDRVMPIVANEITVQPSTAKTVLSFIGGSWVEGVAPSIDSGSSWRIVWGCSRSQIRAVQVKGRRARRVDRPANRVSAIVVGVVWVNPMTNLGVHPVDRSADLCLDVLTYGSLVSCAFWVWRMKGFRWYAASVMLLVELPTWGAFCIAGMAITGYWL